MTGYLFAGQGSQYVGMGKDLYESSPAAREVFEKADRVLGFSLSALCFEGPKEELTLTVNCQPAILTMSIAAWHALREAHGKRADGKGFAAGLSLGEYSALVAAGAVSFEDAVLLVRKRGQFMEEAARVRPGAMASIIGLDRAAVTKLAAEQGVEIANLNCPGQTVISGSVDAVEKAQAAAKQAGAKMAVRLEVSGAFHSSFMRPAADRLAAELKSCPITAPHIPVVTNVTAGTVETPESIRENLVKQVYSSVLWEDSVSYMLSRGVSSFFEFGPGKVLKGLMRRINPEAKVTVIEKKEDLAGLHEVR